MTLFNLHNYGIMKAKDAEKILSSPKHLEKGYIYQLVHPLLSTGLLTSHSEKWFQRRRMLTPAFHFNILKNYFEIFKEESDSLVKTLEKTNEKVIDINPVSTQYTLNSVCGELLKTSDKKLGKF